MNKVTSLIALVIAIITLSGCGTLIPYTQGKDFSMASVSSIKKSETTQAEILTMFGDAPIKGSDEKGAFWKYSHQSTVMLQTSVKRLTVWFNEKRVVQDFSFQEDPVTGAELLGNK
ncbi:MAG: hypothetical protein ABL903_04720 [Methylococcales bacterium]